MYSLKQTQKRPGSRGPSSTVAGFCILCIAAMFCSVNLQAQSCCSQFTVELVPQPNKPCCFDVMVINNPVGSNPCELLAVQIAAPLGSGIQVSSASGAGNFVAKTGVGLVEWTIPPGAVFPNGTNLLGSVCYDGINGCVPLRLRFFDRLASKWVCEQMIDVCCVDGEPCCSYIEPTVDFADFAGQACSFMFSVNILPGAPCGISQIRVSTFSGIPMQSVSPFGGITSSPSPSNTILFSKNSGTWGVGSHQIAMFILDPQPCDQLLIEFYDPSTGEWICDRSIDVCCPNSGGGAAGCCDMTRTLVQPSGNCCFRLFTEVDPGLLCELTQVRVTLSHQAQFTGATPAPGRNIAWTPSQILVTYNNVPLPAGQHYLGEFCISGYPAATIYIDYYDYNTLSWICFEEIDLTCRGYDDDIFKGPAKRGQSQNSGAVEPVQSQLVSAFSVQPNPSQSSSRVQIELQEAANLNVAVFDLAGRQVMELHSGMAQSGTNTFAVDASALSSGQYLLRLSLDNGTVLTRLLTVH